jgi:hypothetical protein
MEDENRNPFAKCIGINPLYKLRPIDGNPDFKLDIPEFNRGLQPEEFLDWKATIEEVLDFKGVI